MRASAISLGIVVMTSAWAAAQLAQDGAKLVGTGAVGSSAQGWSAALSADGKTLLVGANNDDNAAGAAWVFTRGAEGWRQQGAKLVGEEVTGGTVFGLSVALSRDGSTALIGGPGASLGVGGAWIFERSNGEWLQQGGKLVGADAVGNAGQGTSVSLSGDGSIAVIGASADDRGVGAAWVFVRSEDGWTQQGGKLVGSDASGVSQQGVGVAISADGGTVIVGGPGDAEGSGAAWIFTRSATGWAQQGEKLVGSGAEGRAWQGCRVALSADGDTALLGGPEDAGWRGAAWVFARSGGHWVQQGGKLVGVGAIGSAQEGSSLALSSDGSLAVVGAPGDNLNVGAAFFFAQSDGNWSQRGGAVLPNDAAGRASFGTSVALSSDGATCAIGGVGDNGTVGATWVFTRTPAPETTVWLPVASHAPGLNRSQWRTDLGMLNTGQSDAHALVTFFGASGVVRSTARVPAGAQSNLTDVVAQLGASGSGPVEVVADARLKVTSRTYSQASPDAGGGTQGQGYPAVQARDGLAAGEVAWLPLLKEDAAYHSNIGLVNCASGPAIAKVELFDGSGAALAHYEVGLAASEWRQAIRPFKTLAGQQAMDRGYARVTVLSGAGVFAFASVIDNATNSPTTVTMQR